MKKVILVDDHTLILNSLKKLVDGISGFCVSQTFDSGESFLMYLKEHGDNGVDVVLLDIKMPGMSGIDVLKAINENGYDLNVLPLSMEYDERIILRMIKLGAKGYLLKSDKLDAFENALKDVVTKGFYHSDRVNNVLLKEVTDARSNQLTLSEKEVKFLEYVCTEMTFKEIAKEMFLSPKTIDGYRDDLYKKMGVKSRVGLVLKAMKENLVIPK